jgi:hypothetical protein
MLKTGLLLTIALAITATCSAKDAIQSSVTPLSGATPIVAVNGNPYSPGTFAVGTIQLWYTVNAFQFTPGVLATFSLGLSDINYSNNPNTTYPVALNITQIGSTYLTLIPAPASFSPTGPGWNASSVVTVSIPLSTAQSLTSDGTELVGNLKLDTVPAGAHLNTVTNVQVHVKLVHPTNCLRVFNFITDQDHTEVVTSTIVNVNSHSGAITSLNPYGQLSDNLLIANTCTTTQSFDVKALLDAMFDTNPHGNPGNAVFTFLTSGYVSPTSFLVTAFGTGTPQGEQLCLGNVSVPAGQTFLITVHMGILKVNASLLPPSNIFHFSADLRQAGSACAGPLDSLATPNPVSTALAFSVQ